MMERIEERMVAYNQMWSDGENRRGWWYNQTNRGEFVGVKKVS